MVDPAEAEDDPVIFEPALELEWLLGPDVEIVFTPDE